MYFIEEVHMRQRDSYTRLSIVFFLQLVIFIVPRIVLSQPEWETVPVPFTDDGTLKVVHINNQFIILGPNHLARSEDGLSWDIIHLDFECSFSGIVFGNDIYVLTCDSGAIWSSPDLHSFNNEFLMPEEDAYHTMAVFGNRQFVTSGYSNKGPFHSKAWNLNSENGTTWNRECPDTSIFCLLDAVYQKDMFVAVGAVLKSASLGGLVMTSADGINWTKRSPEITDVVRELFGMAYGNGRFVSIGLHGECIMSEDGLDWTVTDSGSSVLSTPLSFGNGYFISGGSRPFTSPDGVTWSEASLPENASISSIAFGNGRFIAIGGNEQILISRPVQTAAAKSDALNQLTSPFALQTGKTVYLKLLETGAGANIKIILYNNLGRSIPISYRRSGTGDFTIDLSNLSSGVYYLRVISGSTIIKKRITML
jgi:hypothetical protein